MGSGRRRLTWAVSLWVSDIVQFAQPCRRAQPAQPSSWPPKRGHHQHQSPCLSSYPNLLSPNPTLLLPLPRVRVLGPQRTTQPPLCPEAAQETTTDADRMWARRRSPCYPPPTATLPPLSRETQSFTGLQVKRSNTEFHSRDGTAVTGCRALTVKHRAEMSTAKTATMPGSTCVRTPFSSCGFQFVSHSIAPATASGRGTSQPPRTATGHAHR